MNTDIRLSVGFWQHPKTKKTVKRLRLEGVRSLQVLWLWAAQNRPDGNLAGMDEEEIELAADWQGEEGLFFKVCAGMWIDKTPEGYALHDWAEHNPWQAEADARKESARKAAKVRWGNADASKAHKEKDADAMRSQCAGNADAIKAQCPSPLLSSPPHEEREGGENARAHVATAVPENASPPQPDGPKKTDCPGKGHPQRVGFMACWQVYPVKQGEEEAWREWMRLFEAGTLAQAWEIRDAILNMAALDTRWQKGKVPKFAKWLNGKCWNDEPYVEPVLPAPQGAVAVRDGPPVARTQFQKGRQDMEGMAKFLLAADKELAKHGDDTTHHHGTGPHGHALPAANEPGRASGHGHGMGGIVRQPQR